MEKITALLIVLATFCCAHDGYATAPAPIATETPQQHRIGTCAAQYHQKKIDKSQYHQFMTQCLKNPPKDTPLKPPASK